MLPRSPGRRTSLLAFALLAACAEPGGGDGFVPPSGGDPPGGGFRVDDEPRFVEDDGAPTPAPSSEPDAATGPGAEPGDDSGTAPEPTAEPVTEPTAEPVAEPAPAEPEPSPFTLPPCETDADCPGELPSCLVNKQCGICYPGVFRCEEGVSEVCDSPKTGWILSEDCGAVAKTCDENLGKCKDACGALGKLAGTNAGCDFYALDLRNAIELPYDAQNAQYAVIASNTSKELVATITVTRPDGTVQTRNVGPQDLETFLLPKTWGLSGSGRSDGAFRVQSDIPIVAYQFNPLSNEQVFSNDASVLLPASGQGTDYYVVTRATTTAQFPGYLAVVGLDADEPTEVTVTSTAYTTAGDDIPALTPGQTATFPIAAGEVVAIEAPGGDLTGTRVQSDKPIMVFGGHTASATATVCCADHLEQQLPPVTSWGKEYVLGRSWPRGQEKDYVRVVASKDGTKVSIAPGVSPAVVTLNAGQHHEWKVSGHVRVTADAPVLVSQFLASSQEVGMSFQTCVSNSDCPNGYVCAEGFFVGECAPIGDPALLVGVPVEEWQTDFVFLTPSSYAADYVNVVAKTGTTVTLDGAPVAAGAFEVVGTTGYGVYRKPLSDGVHVLTASAPVSVVVYGYDKDVSYGYPAGVGLKSKSP